MSRSSLLMAVGFFLSCSPSVQGAGICGFAVQAVQAPPITVGSIPNPPKVQPSQVPLATPAPENTSRPDVFTELTLFLFGSGLALFVALLGWSDQIRSINKDTRELEEKFLKTSGIEKNDFVAIVKAKSPDEELEALMHAMMSETPKTATQADVLKIFKTWNREWSRLERLSAWKYRLAVALTYALFAAGIISLFVNPDAQVSLCFGRTRALLLILLVPMVGILAILTIIVLANQKESYFHELLNSLSEKV